MENEKWQEEVMQSLQGITKAEPNPFLFTRIEARIEQRFGRVAVWKVRVAAVVMVFLIVINSVALLRQQAGGSRTEQNEYSLSGIQSY